MSDRLAVGDRILVSTSRFRSRKAVVTYSDRYGAIVDILGVGSIYFQKYQRTGIAGSVCFNYGRCFIVGRW